MCAEASGSRCTQMLLTEKRNPWLPGGESRVATFSWAWSRDRRSVHAPRRAKRGSEACAAVGKDLALDPRRRTLRMGNAKYIMVGCALSLAACGGGVEAHEQDAQVT